MLYRDVIICQTFRMIPKDINYAFPLYNNASVQVIPSQIFLFSILKYLYQNYNVHFQKTLTSIVFGFHYRFILIVSGTKTITEIERH